MSGALAGAKLVQALAKHGQLVALLGDSDDVMAAFLSLLFTHKWANVLHEVVTATLLQALQQGDSATLIRVLRAGLVSKTVAVLRGEAASGNRGHLLLLANALKDCSLVEVQEALNADPDWSSWQPALTELNVRNLSFRQIGDQEAAASAITSAPLPVRNGPTSSPFSSSPFSPLHSICRTYRLLSDDYNDDRRFSGEEARPPDHDPREFTRRPGQDASFACCRQLFHHSI